MRNKTGMNECASAMKYVRRAFILADVPGSDHAPVGVDVDPAIFGAKRAAQRARARNSA